MEEDSGGRYIEARNDKPDCGVEPLGAARARSPFTLASGFRLRFSIVCRDGGTAFRLFCPQRKSAGACPVQNRAAIERWSVLDIQYLNSLYVGRWCVEEEKERIPWQSRLVRGV